MTLDRDGEDGDPTETARLECTGDGSDTACDLATALPDEFAEPVPADVACTEIYGGPDVATVEGTLRGEQVSATFTRENGCEIDRFDRIAPLLRELFPGYRPGEALRP